MPTYKMKVIRNVSDDYRNNVIMGKSNDSYALNRKVTELFHTNSWKGRRCFIVGGGESLKGFNFDRLNGEFTIGINKTFEFFPNSTINYCMDPTFYDQMRNGTLDKPGEPTLLSFWDAYKGLRVFLTPMERKEFGKEVYVVKRLLDPSINRENLGEGIYQGTNSGTGAICLAVALGAWKIYLLGYDFKAVNSTHWHDGYEARDLDCFSKKLLGYRDDVALLKPLLEQAGVEVINLNPDSELRCFPFGDIDRVLYADLS